MRAALPFLLLAALALPSGGRTFTNTEGDTIEAEIASATEESVTFKMPNGSTPTVALSKLSEEDRKFIQAWRAKQVPDIRVTPKFVRSNRDSRSSSSIYSTEGRQVQILEMTVEVETWDRHVGLDDAELTYILVGRSTADRSRYKILSVQNNNFQLLPGGKAEVPFKTVKNHYVDSTAYQKGARCIGYVLAATRKGDDRPFYTSASSPLLEDAIPTIVTLQAGEETDENFIKIPNPEGETKDKPDVITVR